MVLLVLGYEESEYHKIELMLVCTLGSVLMGMSLLIYVDDTFLTNDLKEKLRFILKYQNDIRLVVGWKPTGDVPFHGSTSKGS